MGNETAHRGCRDEAAGPLEHGTLPLQLGQYSGSSLLWLVMDGETFVIIQGFPNVTSSVVQRVLSAPCRQQRGLFWILWTCCHRESHHGWEEHLRDVYHFFSGLMRNRKTRNSEPQDGCADPASVPDPDFPAGKSAHASQDFGRVAIASDWCLSNVPES